MVWLLAGQTYLITCWAVRRWTKGAAASFCSSVLLQKVDNFTVGCGVVIFSSFGLELRERFPHSRSCHCPPWKTVVLEMFWIIKQSSPLHLVLERTLYLLVSSDLGRLGVWNHSFGPLRMQRCVHKNRVKTKAHWRKSVLSRLPNAPRTMQGLQILLRDSYKIIL